MTYSNEYIIKIHNDEDESVTEIGDDTQDMGCVELRFVNQYGKCDDKIILSPELAILIGNALIEIGNKKLTESKIKWTPL